jgi:hypothetical protein
MEIWKDIKGYEGRYQVSSYGNIKSLNYHRERKEKILSLCSDADGYCVVLLYKNGKRKMHKVHRIVAETFLTNEKKYPCINHKDENKQNNKVSNLEYCTVAYNNRYSKAIPIEQCDLDGNVIKEWECARDAERGTDIRSANITACCKKNLQTAGGYIWRYAN